MDSYNQININGNIPPAFEMSLLGNAQHSYLQQPLNYQPPNQQPVNQQLPGTPKGVQGQNPGSIINYTNKLQGSFIPQQQHMGQTFGPQNPAAFMLQQQQMRTMPPQPQPSRTQQQQQHLHLRLDQQQSGGFHQANTQHQKSHRATVREAFFKQGQNLKSAIQSHNNLPPVTITLITKGAMHNAITGFLNGFLGYDIELGDIQYRPASKPLISVGGPVGVINAGHPQCPTPNVTPQPGQNDTSSLSTAAICIDLTQDEMAGKPQARQDNIPTPISQPSSPVPVSAAPGSTKAVDVPGPREIKVNWPQGVRTVSKIMNLRRLRENVWLHYYDAPDGVDENGKAKTKEMVVLWEPALDTFDTMPVARYLEDQAQKQAKNKFRISRRVDEIHASAAKGPVLCSNCKSPVDASRPIDKPVTKPQRPPSNPKKRRREDSEETSEEPPKRPRGRPRKTENPPKEQSLQKHSPPALPAPNSKQQTKKPCKSNSPPAPAAPTPPLQKQPAAPTLYESCIDPAILEARRRARAPSIDLGSFHRPEEHSSPAPAEDDEELLPAELQDFIRRRTEERESLSAGFLEDLEDEEDDGLCEELLNGFGEGEGDEGVDGGVQDQEGGGQAAELMDQREEERALEEVGGDIPDDESEESEAE